jgi:aspartate kinase
MLTVAKFGGTSMGDAVRMLSSARVAVHHEAGVVVVSATSGTTNDLIKLGQTAEQGSWAQVEPLLQALVAKHRKIEAELHCSAEIVAKLENLYKDLSSLVQGICMLKDCSLKAMDALMSFGERLSSELFVTAMETELNSAGKASKKVQWLDARDVVATDENFSKATPQTDLIVKQGRALPGFQDCKAGRLVYVTQGFIGKSRKGHTTTLGRGGSDYSAAIFAEGFGAENLQIWTDVAGIATTDPRMVPQAKPIPEISFTEASELATFGAKVLHPATLLPALRQNIPVFVGSSFDPDQRGTWVKMQVKEQPLVRALALRKKQVLITLTTPAMLQAHGFLAKIFQVFADHQVSVDSITTSEIGVALTVDSATLANLGLLKALAEHAEVSTEQDLALVSIIGNNINHTAGLAKRIFDAIPDINVRMICLGASRHNFCFLVSESHAEKAIQKLHKEFCE